MENKTQQIESLFRYRKLHFYVVFFLFFLFFSSASAAIETVRPTGSYSLETWTTAANGYDGNTSTSGSGVDLNKEPSISYGGSAAAEATNSWQVKTNSWTAATAYITFSKTAGSDDTVKVEITNSSGTLISTVVASTSSAVTKQEFSITLNSADWGGVGFPNIANLRFRVSGVKVGKKDGSTSYVYDTRVDGTYTAGSLTVDIVDSGGTPVASPAVTFSGAPFSWTTQQSTGTLGVASEKIRLTNTTTTPAWTLSVAATSGPTTLWSGGTYSYDFNGTATTGRLEVDASSGASTPEGGCSNTGVSLGSATYFNQGVTDSITIISADGTADTSCYWDLTGVSLTQDLPARQEADTYSLSLTLTAA